MTAEEATYYAVFEPCEGTLVQQDEHISSVSYHASGEDHELFCLWMNDPGDPVILTAEEARSLISVLNGWLGSARWEPGS